MARFGFSFFDSGVRFGQPDAHPTHMKQLAPMFEVPFDDPSIGSARLIAFATDNLQRMIANNPGNELDPRITATTSSLELYTDCLTDDQTKLGVRKSRKMAKDAFRESIPGSVAKFAGSIVAQYGSNAPELAECFPEGRTIFSTCRDDEVLQHLETLSNGVNAHVADLGAPLGTKVTQLIAAWVAIYNASETSAGQKTTTEAEKKMARNNLALMLFLNLVKLMEMFPRQPEKLALYMTQSLLEVPGSDEEEEPEPPPPAPPVP